MRRKFRLALLLMLTTLSASSAVMWVESCFTDIRVECTRPTWSLSVGVRAGVLAVHHTVKDEADGKPGWRLAAGWVPLRTDIARSSVVAGLRGFALRRYGTPSRGTFLRTMICPLWVPLATFGAWPLAEWVRHRRRQQVRGFDVKPVR